MSKRLIVCCDGTWNTPDKNEDGSDTTTNVVRMAEGILAVSGVSFEMGLEECAVKSSIAADGIEQVVCYCRGVGTGRVNRWLGGIFGRGLSRNIKNVYEFLVKNYESGDEIFLFGFSRGAYTVRSLAGLIRNSGILRKEYGDRLDEAYSLYRKRLKFMPRSVDTLIRGLHRRTHRPNSKTFTSRATSMTTVALQKWQRYVQYRERKAFHPDSEVARSFREKFSREARIHFIGVWDTVGALGIPEFIPFISRLWNRRCMFHDVKLSSSVDNAFHALSIDERRKPFSPALWNQAGIDRDKRQQLEQIWFVGDHSDVGGGHADPDKGLPDLTLSWMVGKAQHCGLDINLIMNPDPSAGIHDSLTWAYKCLRQKKERVIIDRGEQVLHPSVMERFQSYGEKYCPRNIVNYLAKCVMVPPADASVRCPPGQQ